MPVPGALLPHPPPPTLQAILMQVVPKGHALRTLSGDRITYFKGVSEPLLQKPTSVTWHVTDDEIYFSYFFSYLINGQFPELSVWLVSSFGSLAWSKASQCQRLCENKNQQRGGCRRGREAYLAFQLFPQWHVYGHRPLCALTAPICFLLGIFYSQEVPENFTNQSLASQIEMNFTSWDKEKCRRKEKK